jgi:hypothetical protein
LCLTLSCLHLVEVSGHNAVGTASLTDSGYDRQQRWRGALNSIDTSLGLGKSAEVLFSTLEVLNCRYFLIAGCEVLVVSSAMVLSGWAGIGDCGCENGEEEGEGMMQLEFGD